MLVEEVSNTRNEQNETAIAKVYTLSEIATSRREYEESVELVHSIRDSNNSLCDGQVQHWSMPASQISADFFCSAEHPRKGWYCLLADTAGHGLPSAIFSLQTPLLFREAVQLGQSLPEIYTRIHAALLRQHLANYFVCGLLVRVTQRDIEVVNAGMPEALLLARDGRLIETFSSQLLPFGVVPMQQVVEQRYRLAIGEEASLLLYSDGLVELGAPAGAALGEAGVRAALSGEANKLAERLVERIGTHGHSAHDDISIVVIRAPLGGKAEAELPAAMEQPHVAGIDAARHIVEGCPRGIMLTDAEQRILYVNPSFTALTGYAAADVFGRTSRMLGTEREPPVFYQRMWHALNTEGRWSGDLWLRHKDGLLQQEYTEICALRDGAGVVTHYMLTFLDALAIDQARERIQHKALHDPLTDLANRTLLNDRGEQALRHAERLGHCVGVLFIDLDRFKSINDSLGHDIGDLVLIEVAGRLGSVLRDGDTLSRWIGDEFVCLLPEIGRQHDAGVVAGKLLTAMEDPIAVAGHNFKVGISIGISTYPDDASQLDQLVIEADRAMMLAKQAGGNIYRFYSPEMHLAMEKQLEMEARLDAAIRNGELVLYYQPKINLEDWRIEGAEALVRWRDPQRGLVPPGEFIPVAERSDLIAKIGNWVLNEACAALARWQGHLPTEFHVAVNVSPLQLARSDLYAEVGSALQASAVAPSRLQLEVTESLFIQDAKGSARTLKRVGALGVSLALDDFGTGYSNLSSLAHLPINTFKLDQSFVRGIDTNRANSSIAQSVWHLADGLDKDMVVEGVETCGECRHIETMGYRTLQGYKFGKPMAEADFLKHLHNWPDDHCPFHDDGCGDGEDRCARVRHEAAKPQWLN
ncbi:MAG: EAL domain-containing protein [Rhodocyclaceae bacterium]|nr:EAL domain-containing protein [Rhodocyclaceae bacterium]MDZ4214951.1 EAL domain-containing protein [Rhodocyclaceae bacterium]